MKLSTRVDRCVRQSTWVDFGLLKVCLCAFGVMIGVLVPKKSKKSVLAGSALLFSVSLVPLVIRSYQKMYAEKK